MRWSYLGVVLLQLLSAFCITFDGICTAVISGGVLHHPRWELHRCHSGRRSAHDVLFGPVGSGPVSPRLTMIVRKREAGPGSIDRFLI